LHIQACVRAAVDKRWHPQTLCGRQLRRPGSEPNRYLGAISVRSLAACSRALPPIERSDFT
jgi:hypothetical protein